MSCKKIFFIVCFFPFLTWATDIHELVKKEDYSRVFDLVLNNPEIVNKKDEKGKIPLHYAIENDQVQMMKFLIEQGSDTEIRNGDNRTLLHLASILNDLEFVKLLIAKGAEVSPIDKDGNTPLHYAAFRNYIEVVKYLVAQGGKIHLQNKWKGTPYNMAFNSKNRDVLGFFEQQEEKMRETHHCKELF